MAQMIKNSFRMPKNKLNYSRSLHRYTRTHSTNMLTGYIVPVGYIPLMPGDTPPKNFGFVLQSAPLLGPSFDNIYIDIISVWCPDRLVWEEHNQWLGDNDRFAWTLNRDLSKPKITSYKIRGSFSYYAEHYLAPHYGARYFGEPGSSETGEQTVQFSSIAGTASRFHDGVQVLPFRQYDLIYNKLFRNENIINPVLLSKQSGTDLSTDVTNYGVGLGTIKRASRLKNMFVTARYSPAIQTIDIGMGVKYPVITQATEHASSTQLKMKKVDGTAFTGRFSVIGSTAGNIFGDSTSQTGTYGAIYPSNLYADLSALTVNNLYYAIMLQKYMNKASTGRRPVEFYQEFFGIESSEVGHDDPQLLSQKRFKVNITRVVATANSENDGTNQPIGTQGAYSLTVGNGSLFPSFTATEYGMLHVFAVIRTQESIASGFDRYLSDSNLLSTYLPVFDHIGEDYIESLEFSNVNTNNNNYVFGYQSAWYNYRYFNNDVVGIMAPDQPLEYFTLARRFVLGDGNFTVNEEFISQSPLEFDRMLQFPVFYGGGDEEGFDIDGEPYLSNRYQWIIQFAISGDFARTMSKDSSQLDFRI